MVTALGLGDLGLSYLLLGGFGYFGKKGFKP
jgi:hypothetical protein